MWPRKTQKCKPLEKPSLSVPYTQTVNTNINLLSSFQSEGTNRSNVLLLAYDKHRHQLEWHAYATRNNTTPASSYRTETQRKHLQDTSMGPQHYTAASSKNSELSKHAARGEFLQYDSVVVGVQTPVAPDVTDDREALWKTKTHWGRGHRTTWHATATPLVLRYNRRWWRGEII